MSKLTQAAIKQTHRSAILRLIKDEGTISRTEISQRLHLSRTTATVIANELLEDVYKRQGGGRQWIGQDHLDRQAGALSQGAGRPRAPRGRRHLSRGRHRSVACLLYTSPGAGKEAFPEAAIRSPKA